MFDTYLRPNEMIEMKTEQVIEPQAQRGMDRVALVINPEYYNRPSKTGELDESLHISRAWLGRLLLRYKRLRKSPRLWDHNLLEMRRIFLLVAEDLCIGHLRPCLYMARHSGASIDRLENRLSLQEVQRRGRWRCEASVRRYEKRAMAQEVASRLSPVQMLAFTRAAAEIERILGKALGGSFGKDA